MKILWAQSQRILLEYTFFNTLNLTSWNSFFKDHPIQPFEMKDLPFSGKSAFQHKDGAQCLWFSYPSEKQALFFFFELYALLMLKAQTAKNFV